MKRSLLFWIVITTLSITLSYAQDKKDAPPAMDDATKKYLELISPDEHHKKLDAFVGSWETTTDMFMAPGAPPQHSTGSAEFKWVLGGRYLEQNVSSTIMGTPFHGIGFIGYDKSRKNYFMTWMDDMGTAFSSATGQYDPTDKILTLYGTMDDPMGRGIAMNEKYVTQWVDDNTFKFSIYELSVGENAKIIEMTYTRKK